MRLKLLKLNRFIFYLIIFEEKCNAPFVIYSDQNYYYYVVLGNGVLQQQRRINACARVPTDHPLQPPMIEPLQFIHVDAKVVDE